MTREEIISAVKDEIENSGRNIDFAVPLWNGYDEVLQSGCFTKDGIIRDINGMQVEEEWDEVDDDVLENCWECRTTTETEGRNAILNMNNAKRTLVSVINDICEQKIGEDENEYIDLHLCRHSVKYECIVYRGGRYKVVYVYLSEYGEEYEEMECMEDMDGDMLANIFNEIV